MNATTTRVDVNGMLEDLGRAISSNDQRAIASCFDAPCMFVGDAVMPMMSTNEVLAAFDQGRSFYEENGIVSTRPDIESLEHLNDSLVEATVRWPGFDKDGKENWSERSRYIIRTVEGKPRICVAITLGGQKV